MNSIVKLVLLLVGIPFLAIAKEKDETSLFGKTRTIQTEDGSVIWRYVDDEKLQVTIGGTGGSVYRITVDNTHFNEPHAGTQISFQVVAIGGKLIKYENGMPIFEIWGRAGGGTYGRGVMKFVDGKYKTVKSASFTIHKNGSKINPIYTPGDIEKKMPLYPEN